MSRHVVVLGSVNVDLSLTCARLPGPGETLVAVASARSAGGKGANQAVGCARAGGMATTLIASVGADVDGEAMIETLSVAGVSTTSVHALAGRPTGTAYITVDLIGENTIVVDSGANACLKLDGADRKLLAEADAVLAQLESPQSVLAEGARLRRHGVPFILNAAPAAILADELLREVDVLVVNEPEAVQVAAGLGAAPGDADPVSCARVLARAVPSVIVTLGSQGAHVCLSDGTECRVPAPRVEAVDTVAAGDTFCGVLAARLAEGVSELEAVRHASAAASLTVQAHGAQSSIPTEAEARSQFEAIYG